jgi:hypothetical protein
MQPDGRTDGITRRQALKRAAAVGALAWATPVVETLTAQRAWAASPQGLCYSVKLDPYQQVYFNGNNANGFKCCDPDALHVGDGGSQVGLTINNDGTWTVTLAPGCSFESGYTHGGPKPNDCVANPAPNGTNGAIVFYPNGKHKISNVQLSFCCPQQGG